MSNEEEKRCPLCAEEMDWTDQQLKPCKCGYEVCVWCWHHIMDMAEKDATEGRCPACRTPYDKDKIVGMEANFERVVASNSNRKQKQPKPKPKTAEGRKDLSNVRVIQRKMAYIIGLPLSLADEDLLQRRDYFGQYGKVTKVSLSRTAGGAVQQFVNDTCSVYITYSKEEEAVRCIQSVHGYVLEGRYLRASFGTAKYCHAWLRNMPCNNPACLYLHSVGAEEDSFGKDEVAAVHTRNRVQEIVGAAQYLQRRTGSVLPPPVDEHISNHCAFAAEPVTNNGLKDVVYTVNSGDHFTCSKERDGMVRPSKQMTTFVDIVGRSCNSGPEKDENLVEDARILNLCSDISSACIDKSNHVEVDKSDLMLCKSLSSSQLVNGFPMNKLFNEPFREPLKLLPTERANLTCSGTCFTKEQPCLMLDSRRKVPHHPCNITREDSLSSADQRLKDSVSLSKASSFVASSHPANLSEDFSNHSWWHMESHSQNDHGVDYNTVNKHTDEASIQSTCVNSVLNDGYNEKKFQSLAKSDRIYRCSNSFSNEEIVEHLRRLDDDTMANDDENSAAVESSIISNILSMDFDACDDSTLPGTLGRLGSSWNFLNSDQLGFSFANEQGFSSQASDLDSSFSNIGQELKKPAVIPDSGENKDHYSYKPQYYASRAQSVTPPGFSAQSKPPPGFSSCGRTEQVFSAGSGIHLMKSSLPNNHYRTPSSGNLSNSSDDLIDPAILVVGRGTNGLNNSCLDTRPSSYALQPSAFEDEAKLWLLMQQSASAHQDLKFSQTYMQQATPSHQELRYSSNIGNGFSSQDDFYGGLTSRLVDQHHQSYNPSSFTQYFQPKFANGHISNGYQLHPDEVQHRSEVGISDLQRNDRIGLSNFFPGYGDYMFQMPSSGDVYTRVFGM